MGDFVFGPEDSDRSRAVELTITNKDAGIGCADRVLSLSFESTFPGWYPYPPLDP